MHLLAQLCKAAASKSRHILTVLLHVHVRMVCRWNIPGDTPDGVYRLVHYGDAKTLPWATPQPFQGNSSSFTVTGNPSLLQLLLAAVGPSIDMDAAAAKHHTELCRLLGGNLWPRDAADAQAGDSSWSSMPEQPQGRRQGDSVVRHRLGCRAH
jgi:hypothetical protein